MGKKRLMVTGGETAGMRAAFRACRMNSDFKTLAFECGEYTSCSA